MISQSDLFHVREYPEVPGARPTDTSRAAAKSVDADTLRQQCLVALCEWGYGGGLTADECADVLSESPLAIRPRLSELRRMDKVEDSGHRRSNTSGKKAIVWKLTQQKDNK